MHIDISYAKLLETIMKQGVWYDDPNRENIKRLEIPSYTFRHEFKDGFPAISTKKLFFKSVVTELIWFLKGDTNIKYLVDNGCNIWNKDAYKHYLKNLRPNETPVTMERFIEVVKTLNMSYIKSNKSKLGYVYGDLGPVYGHQWVNSTKITPTGSGHYKKTQVNQIQELIENMVEKPMSSELLVNAWNPVDLKEMALQPCHYGFQIIMRPLSEPERYRMLRSNSDLHSKFLSEQHIRIANNTSNNFKSEFLNKVNIYKYGFELHWNQRSCDSFLGIPFNIASYATLALMLEKVTGHKALAIQGDLKKVHLYDNSIDGVNEQLSRKSNGELVQLEQSLFIEAFEGYNPLKHDYDILTATLLNIADDIKLLNYKPHPAIKVEMLERT